MLLWRDTRSLPSFRTISFRLLAGHLMGRADSLEKTLMLGKIEGRTTRGQQRMRWLDGITDSMEMSLSELQEIVRDREAWHAAVQRVGHGWATEQLVGPSSIWIFNSCYYPYGSFYYECSSLEFIKWNSDCSKSQEEEKPWTFRGRMHCCICSLLFSCSKS